MATNWTDEQLQAINVEGNNVIVSAGAGSGKTAVLSERVLRKVKDGIPVNRLLILTFTNMAAFEMKDRIRKKLKKEGFLEEVKLIDSSYITTFDSYSLSLVNKYHSILHLDKNVMICDSTLIEIRKKEILDKIMDERYKKGSISFSNLISHFALKNDESLKKSILNINSKLDLKYDKRKYLENYEKNFYNEEYLDKIVDTYFSKIKSIKESIKELTLDISSILSGKALNDFNDKLSGIINSNTYEEIKNSISNFSSPRKTKEYDSDAVSIKDEIKAYVDILKDLCIYDSLDEIKEKLLETKEDTLEIVDILLELDKRFDEVKYKEKLFDFTDISHLAIKLVKEHSDIREEIKSSFNEILIDEYQDTNDIQEMFISEISNNNVYMVGDVKQSIYRFRNANPYIFKNKYDAYKNDSIKGIKIDLNKNFRSRSEVLDDINLIFSSIMDDEIGGADYASEHKMIFGNTTYINEGKTDNRNMNIITYEEDKDFKNNVKEIFIAAQDIKNKVESNYQVFDKDLNKLRCVDYSDFAILLDVKKNFNLYKQIFGYLNIPLALYSDTDITLSSDIYVLKNLIKLVLLVSDDDYGTLFKYCYTSISRSFLFNKSDEEIFEVFKDNSFKDTDIVMLAKGLSKKIKYLPLKSMFYEIINTFKYEEKLLTTTNILEKEHMLEYIINLLDSLSLNGYTLYDLSYYLETIIEDNLSIKYKPYEENSNSVKIMSIHASKGLEFPICYFLNLENKFNQGDLKENISFDNNYGILLPIVGDDVKPTITMLLSRINNRREDISERIRLLYVALTRAKENINIIIPKKEEESLLKNIVSNSKRDKYNSFNSIMKSINGLLLPYTKEEVSVSLTDEYLYERKNRKLDLLDEKINVSNLEFNFKEKESTKFSKSTISLVSMEEEETMDIGTKVHKVLEQIDFKNPRLDEINLDSFLLNKVKKFINSSLIQDNLNSSFYKEYEFMIEEDNEIKRGVIDLMIENDNEVIIVDYKLSNVLDEAYKKQLNGYRDYIKTKTNKNISIYLYSIIGEELTRL